MGRQANPELATRWRELVSTQHRSGLTMAAFCRQEGLSVSSFYAWKRRFGSGRLTAREPASARRYEPTRPASAAQFVPLSLSPSAASDSITIERADGLVLHVPCHAQALRTVLAVLDERSC